MGATAVDIIQQTNSRIPFYNPRNGNDPASNQRANEVYIRAQMANDPAYNPNLRNATNNNAAFLSPNKDLNKLICENIIQENPARNIQRLSCNYYNTPEFAKETKSYTDALAFLQDMATNKKPLSLADAYFAVEYAYGNCYLTQQEYKKKINELATFVKKWMVQNSLNPKNNDDVHFALQKTMFEELQITTRIITNEKQIRIGSIKHKPFFYDYVDYEGDKDYRNYFITKCLATGAGQCSSLPVVYLCLAEALGTDAYLTFAPQHSFIKYKDNSGNIVNFEPTSGWKISDKWYQEDLFISQEAKRNGIYLDTLNRKDIIGECIINLALGYMKKFGATDTKFIDQCMEAATSAFSRPRVEVLFVRSSMLARMLGTVAYDAGINNYEELDKSKEAAKIYQALEQNEKLIKQTGYRDIPVGAYEQMLKEAQFKGKLQDSLRIDGKLKRDLFIKSN